MTAKQSLLRERKAKNQRDLRKRRADAGLKLVRGIYATVENERIIKAFAKRLNRRPNNERKETPVRCRRCLLEASKDIY